MKRVLAFILAIGMILVMAACGDEKNGGKEEKKMDYDNLTADDLLKDIKDKKNVTADEYAELISTYSYVKITDDMNLEENITDEAIKKLRDNGAKIPSRDEYVPKLLKNDAPQVRGYAIMQLQSFSDKEEKTIKELKSVIEKEKEPYVLCCLLKVLTGKGEIDPEIWEFMLDSAENENSQVRRWAAFAIGNKGNKGLDGAVDAMLKLMDDSNVSVRDWAYHCAGELYDERIIDPIVKTLNNPAEKQLHGQCIISLVTLWYDYPGYESTSEKAYKATMDYLKKPVSDGIPAWSAVSAFDEKSDDNFEEWRAKATYYNPDEIAQIMIDLVKNPEFDRTGRENAISVVANHCSSERFAELGDVVNGLTDEYAEYIKEEYQSVAESNAE